MDGHEFYQNVDSHPDLEWLGVKEDCEDLGDAVVILERSRDVKHAVAIRAILQHDWETLEAVLTSERPANLIGHLSRIVGYYSRVANWNFSKLAELSDRHKGDYTLGEPPKKKVMVPGVVGRKGVGAESGSRTRTPV